MRTDLEIKEDVLEELSWQPNIDETEIGVIVENGVVSLTGIVDNFQKKVAAEKAVKKVAGVKAVAEDIEVRYGTSYDKSDKEIAKAVVHAFKWDSIIPEDKIAIEIRDGWVYISGELKWSYQKDAAKRVVENIFGVKGVINNINIKQAVKPDQIKKKITKAFKRLADVDANNIIVSVDGHKVKLSGKVHSISEKDEARKTAYYAAGVYEVENELEVVN